MLIRTQGPDATDGRRRPTWSAHATRHGRARHWILDGARDESKVPSDAGANTSADRYGRCLACGAGLRGRKVARGKRGRRQGRPVNYSGHGRPHAKRTWQGTWIGPRKSMACGAAGGGARWRAYHSTLAIMTIMGWIEA